MQSRKKLLILAHMIKVNKDALLCDLAETYHIYNYKELPCKTVALFACGLRNDSRIKMQMNDIKIQQKEILLAIIADRLGTLVWFKTKDGVKGINRPKSILSTFLEVDEKMDKNVMSFESAREFEEKWESIAKGE